MNAITVTKKVVEAKFGKDLLTCIQEAAIMALTDNTDVHLIHNDKAYVIQPKKIKLSIFDQHP